ncbi:sugar ABC transporter substrate-binding protein [Rhizobium sp. KVB221]|uniref:Sugar ABC transporter substrate-binding protein n=1 Tax=Rhizobium setariae TaxID=2801340 RepID=A0A936YT11_9HYPH|nr:sugar ABC transporter substrate-binding protein [Rhizobium setariae]MBL0374291.1 sugar ABC transporter substrate-binding protein [Rhizobium setariae]
MKFHTQTALYVGLAMSFAAPALAQEPDGTLDGEGKEIVVLMPSRSNAYLAQWIRGAEQSAKEGNYKLTVIENNFDQTEQDAQAQQRLGMPEQPLAYVWWPADNQAGLATLNRLSRSGVPVFQVNQGVQPEAKDLVVAYAGVNDFFNGQIAAKNAIEARDAFVKAGNTLHGDGGNMVILKFIPGYSAGDDREAGFKDATKDKPFTIVGTEFAGFDNASGYKAMSQLIPSIRDGGIDFVYGMSDGPVTGAVKALEEAGLTPGKDVYLVSATCIADISAIGTAKEFATGVQAAGLEGWFSINVVARYFEYGKQVKDGEYVAPDTTDARPEFNFAPSKVNIIPNPQVVVGNDPAKAGDVLNNFKLWGQTFNDHCVY